MDKESVNSPIEASGREQILQQFHNIQKKKSDQQYISRRDVKEVAETLKISPSEVDGVLSFYRMYSPYPRGRFIIRLCDSLSCRISQSLKIYDHICSSLGIHKDETTKDGLFTLEIVNCLGNCDTAPNMMINDKLYTNLTVGRVEEILASCRQEVTL